MENHNNKDNTYSEDSSHKQEKVVSEPSALSKKNKRKIVFTVSFILVILFALFLCLPRFLPQDQLVPNVTIGNVDIGKMTLSQASEAIKNRYVQPNINFSVSFNNNGNILTTSFSSSDIELTAHPKDSLVQAYKIGRSDNHLKNSYDILRSWFFKNKIEPVYECNTDKLSKIFQDFGAKIYGTHEDVKYNIDNNILTIIPETPGPDEDVSAAVDEFLSSLEAGVYKDIPITLNRREKTLITAEDIREQIYSAPVNPRYIVQNNTVTITDPVPGRDAVYESLAAAAELINSSSPAAIELIPLPAEISKESLKYSLFNSTLASYSSKYKSSSENRAYNVELAASKINGIILADGEEFSYNKIIGNAGLESGYKTSTVYSGGKITEGVGGGVCQVSSTLYCAVLRSCLEVTKRTNHSMPVAYVPGGQDATVAYDYIDFRFKNNTGAPLKIVASCSNREVTISLIGSDSAYKYVEVTSEKTENIMPEIITVEDPSLTSGKTKVITEGTPGGIYITHRKIYNTDGTLFGEQNIKSTYKAISKEVAVGTATP